jgi:hypothetical protein
MISKAREHRPAPTGRRVDPDGLETDGLETRRWNGTKSAFADCGPTILADPRRRAAPARDRVVTRRRP